jgi:hypothetical protein
MERACSLAWFSVCNLVDVEPFVQVRSLGGALGNNAIVCSDDQFALGASLAIHCFDYK